MGFKAMLSYFDGIYPGPYNWYGIRIGSSPADGGNDFREQQASYKGVEVVPLYGYKFFL